jgi:hypothetical protein
VRDCATEEEWREIISALQKMFEGVVEEERPDCITLSTSRKRKKG